MQITQDVKIPVKPVENKDTLSPLVRSILIEIADIGLLQSIENIVGADVCKEYVAIIKAIQNVEKPDLKQKKAVFSLKNAIFFFKNNLKCEDLPLTNISLEADKFSYLLKFIGKDAGIKTAINDKHGEVALKELEALVMAHDERGDEFISKFVEKNVKLYHSLRNTALEKILRQISVVHGKVKNIDLPQTAKNSAQYHIAIKRLDSIVYSDFTRKILLIEDIKFEFDFLSTILLVWRTETTKQAEAALKIEEAKRVSEAENEKRNVKAVETPSMKSEPFTPIFSPSKAQESARSVQKPILTERRLRTIPSKVEKVIDDPDDPDPVDFPNDPEIKPNSVAIVLKDDTEKEQVSKSILPTTVRTSTMVLHSKTTSSPQQTRSSSRQVNANVTPVRASISKTTNRLVQSPSSRPTATTVSKTPALTHIQKTSALVTPEVLPLTPRAAPPKIATTSMGWLVSPGGGGELPIKTKCIQCPDKTSENVEQLIHHYSFMHYREEIERRYIRGGDHCPACNEEFKLKLNLIKHLGLVHSAADPPLQLHALQG